MAVLSDLLSRVRLELGDQPKQFSFTATGDGATTAFNLGYRPVELENLSVRVNGVDKAYPADYSLEGNVGVLHFTTAPANNASIVVSGTVDRYFLDSDLCTFLNTAIGQHTYNKTDSYGSLITLSSLPGIEEYPVVILTVIEALWALATDSSFDIDISAPDGVSIPRSQRFRQIQELINQRWEQYKTLCAQLNIGLWRIEMGTLRRVSRTTNKLVPVYIAQEVDDSRRPERVYLQNDLLGRTPPLPYGQIYDLVIYQGDSFSVEFDFPFDVTGYDFKSQVRTYPNSPSLYATFNVEVLSATSTLSKVKLSLDNKGTAYLPVRAFWDLQMTTPSDPTYENTPLRGQVFVVQQVTLD